MESYKIDYKLNRSELCDIGRKYDTDKSAFRYNVTNVRHCHPYTLFYDSIFKGKKNETLHIAELGILYGSSLLMWQEYFPKSYLYGFEFDENLLSHFKNEFNNERITLESMDVTQISSIQNAYKKVNMVYDLIIDDTTHQFEDQIRIIENSIDYLKPGGMLIIEDIFKSNKEDDYIKRLEMILHNFQEYYFVELDHVNRNSTGWENDKLFILIKNGAKPIFSNNNKLTIITPCYRLNNILNLYDSINFDYVDEWIIVYDQSKIKENPNLFENDEKIKEYLFNGEGISGNPQRNFALSKVRNDNTYLYYLDDDNIIHPGLFKLLNLIDKNKMITFDQENGLKGNNISVNNIDSAMLLIDYNLCKNIKWINHLYNADGYYIKECYDQNRNNYIYINNNMCFYNKLANQ